MHATPACITVTSLGLLLAPEAITRIVPVREELDVLAENDAVIVPLFVPLEPVAIVSQLPPDISKAVQDMVPVPVLFTVNVVVPLLTLTVREFGVTESSGAGNVPRDITISTAEPMTTELALTGF